VAVLPIRIMGDPVLHAPAVPVGDITEEVRTLVADMFETMDAAPGVGLAAPQVGVGLRIFTYSYPDDDGAPWRGVLINPELWMRPLEPGDPDPDEESEGCLSFPGERFPLRRSEEVLVTATDLERVRFEKEQTFETDAAANAESRNVERDLQVTMQRLSSGASQVEGVECRRTTCRATLRSTDLGANRDMLERLADEREGPLATYGFIVPGRDVDSRGEVRSTLFVSIR
jgi:peptide deformylase